MAKRAPKQSGLSVESNSLGDSQATSEVRQAADQLIQAIDTWHAWFATLRKTEDADPGIALRCYEECRAALLALCNHGVTIEPFKSKDLTSIAQMLPPLPNGSKGGSNLSFDTKTKRWKKTPRPRWQNSPELWDAYSGRDNRFDSSLKLRAAALQVRKMLDKYPGAVLSAPPVHSKPLEESKTPRRANQAQIFPHGTAGIDPKLVDFATQLIARRDGKRSDRAIAREITGETATSYQKARSMLQRMSNYRRKGRINF